MPDGPCEDEVRDVLGAGRLLRSRRDDNPGHHARHLWREGRGSGPTRPVVLDGPSAHEHPPRRGGRPGPREDLPAQRGARTIRRDGRIPIGPPPDARVRGAHEVLRRPRAGIFPGGDEDSAARRRRRPARHAPDGRGVPPAPGRDRAEELRRLHPEDPALVVG